MDRDGIYPMVEFTQFERDVLEELVCGSSRFFLSLQRQLKFSELQKRTFNVYGFYLDFLIDKSVKNLTGAPSFVFGDVSAEIEGLQFGAGFLLFVKNGLIASLEGYSYQEIWPKEQFKYRLHYDGENGTRSALSTIRYSRGSNKIVE